VVEVAHLATLVLLVVLAIPFAIRQLRVGLFPALERPYASVWPRVAAPLPMQPATDEEVAVASDAAASGAEGVVAAEAPAELRAMKRARPSSAPPPMSVSTLDQGTYELAYGRANFAPDPNASVPTGPGRPDWSWESVALAWSGPVTADQQLGLWLVPPWANALLAIARVLLLAALARAFVVAWRSARGGDPGAAPSAQPLATRGAAAALALCAVLLSGPARADLPTPELLEELRGRLLEPPACHPNCATLTRLALGVTPERLDLRLALDEQLRRRKVRARRP
jgi:hypothetical protein